MSRDSLQEWISRSLKGHITAGAIMWGVPVGLVFMYVLFTDGVLTPGRGIVVMVMSSLGGVLFGILYWYTFSRPLRKKLRSDGQQK